jgi:site-specific recombinase XerD
VGPYLRQWLDEAARPRVRASTLKSYREIVEGHLVPGLGNIALAKLTPAEVQAFLNRKQASGLSARRVQYIHAVLRRAPVTAERWGMVSRNVARLVDPPRVHRREITPLTPEQARRREPRGWPLLTDAHRDTTGIRPCPGSARDRRG